MKNLGWKCGFLILLFWVLLALLGPFFLEHRFDAYFVEEAYRGFSKDHWLGQGENGVDLFSHIVWGARNTLVVAFVGVLGASFLGVALGSYSAYKGGRVDLILSKFAEVFIVFPGFLLFLTTAVFLGAGKGALILALVVSSWGNYFRYVRGVVLQVKEELFVNAAKALGLGNLRVLFGHIFKNIWAPLWVQMAYGLKAAVLSESSLSYLGLGYEAGTPSWGALLSQGRDVFLLSPHVLWVPGVALFSLLMGFQLLGDGLSALFRLQRID